MMSSGWPVGLVSWTENSAALIWVFSVSPWSIWTMKRSPRLSSISAEIGAPSPAGDAPVAEVGSEEFGVRSKAWWPDPQPATTSSATRASRTARAAGEEPASTLSIVCSRFKRPPSDPLARTVSTAPRLPVRVPTSGGQLDAVADHDRPGPNPPAGHQPLGDVGIARRELLGRVGGAPPDPRARPGGRCGQRAGQRERARVVDLLGPPQMDRPEGGPPLYV